MNQAFLRIKTYFSHPDWKMILVVLLSVPALLALTQRGFFPTQDYIYVARIFEMNGSLHDGQFPVRWVKDFRYGEPLYNFYAPLPYYAASVIHDLGISYLDTSKIAFALSFILSGLAMFLLGRRLFGVAGGIISGVLYIYAPYHSVDIYVRGALSESWALIFFPLIFLFSYDLAKKPQAKSFCLLTLSLAGLFYTHNIMTMLFLPFFIGWSIFLTWQAKNFKIGQYLIVSLLLSIGLAASFLLPAYFEKNYVQSSHLTDGYFDFRGHFVEIKQFFSTFWGYGASLWGDEDGMSFQVGLVHWAGLLLALIFLFINWLKTRKINWLVSVLILAFGFSLFMQHNKSTPIWLAFPLLGFTQFPWRFLGVSIFFASLIGGSLALYLKKWSIPISLIVAIITIVAYVGYFHPESYYPTSTDSDYISTKNLSIDDKLPKDYLPIYIKSINIEKITQPSADSGQVHVISFNKRTSSAQSEIDVLGNSDIEVPISYFPGWELKANGQPIKLEEPLDRGLIRFQLPSGHYNLDFNFGNTPVRATANLISLMSLILLIGFSIKKLNLSRWIK